MRYLGYINPLKSKLASKILKDCESVSEIIRYRAAASQLKMKTISKKWRQSEKWRWPKKWRQPQNEDDLKN